MPRWEYKTLKFQAEGWFAGGKINTEALEYALNDHAAHGWRLVTVITSNSGHGTTRDVVAILERERHV